MRKHEVETLYLEIQSRLGEFSLNCPTIAQKRIIANLSTCLLRIKREWIGSDNEIMTDDIIATVAKEPVNERPVKALIGSCTK